MCAENVTILFYIQSWYLKILILILMQLIQNSVDNFDKYSDLPDSQNFRLVIEVKKNLASFYQKFRTEISENQNTQNDADLIVYYPVRLLSTFLFFWPKTQKQLFTFI